jgi:hypothetical protein
MKKKLIKPKEAITIVIFVILLTAVIFISQRSANTAEIIVISDGSRQTFTVDLSKERVFDIENMQVEVCGGDIRVIRSDCTGLDCVKMGYAGENGGVIVCVPNRVTIRLLTADAENEFDAII